MGDNVHPGTPWHALAGKEVLSRWKTPPEGLSEAEVASRRDQWGPNQLPRRPPTGIGIIFLRQFKSPLIYILMAAAVVSVAIGENTDAIFIAGVLLINAIIGTYQEYRAEKSNEALEKFLKIEASVLRQDESLRINAIDLVPGDIVLLEPGDKVPADLRLLWAHGLELDEAALTGESLPVDKDPHWVGSADTPVADRKNMAQAGTTVARGRGKGVVVATGTQTQIGQLAVDVMGRRGGKPPLILRLEYFTKMVGFSVLVGAFAVSFVGLARAYGIAEMFFFAVALAVSAIPEGLPVAVTVALAIATNRMAKRGVIVRQLAAVEGLGSCTAIASDKTGTLTCNELTVREILLPGNRKIEVTGTGYEPKGLLKEDGKKISGKDDPDLKNMLRTAILCNEADLLRHDDHWVWRGDPTEISLLCLAEKAEVSPAKESKDYPQINEIPFESEYRYAATFNQGPGGPWVFVKGAPERVLSMCQELPPGEDSQRILAEAEKMAERGLRVLALAAAPMDTELKADEPPPEPKGLTFQGLAGMMDPLRPGVVDAVQACHGAGIQVYMITGDHPVTALAIARDLGLAKNASQVMTGNELQECTEPQLQNALKGVRVFSRVTPHDKLQIVEAIRKTPHYVAVTGDGVNDAPALKDANIGVAMGDKGTDVARDASDIVISDDNFATIVAGVEEGRAAYDNVRNVIYLLISTGAAEVIMVGLAIGFGLPLPLLPVQLLWLNLVTNGIQDVALATEPALGDELERKPRPFKERIFNQLMLERIAVGAVVMGGVAFGIFYWLLGQGWSEDSARNAVLLLMVLFENLHLGNSRSETKSAFALSPFRTPFLLFGALFAFSIHVSFLYFPLGQKLLRTEPVSGSTWIFLVFFALSITVAMELHKLSWYLRYRKKVPKKPIKDKLDERGQTG